MSDVVVIPRPLESALFGLSIASVNVSHVADVDTVVAQADEQAADMLVVRVPAQRVDVIQRLEASGAQMCDVLVTYESPLPVRKTHGETGGSDMRVRHATEADLPTLHDIACRAFDDFPGHWHTDTRLQRSSANELYGRWVADLTRNASPVAPLLVLESETGVLAGFLALAQEAAGRWNVPLTAVDPPFRGKGLLRRMLIEASNRIADAGAVHFAYETQLTNWAASRVVSSLGFSPSSARFTFHLWIRRS